MLTFPYFHSALASLLRLCSGTAYTVWPVMWTYLNERGLKQVEEEEALAMVARGAVIVDVRLASDYQAGAGAVG